MIADRCTLFVGVECHRDRHDEQPAGMQPVMQPHMLSAVGLGTDEKPGRNIDLIGQSDTVSSSRSRAIALPLHRS